MATETIVMKYPGRAENQNVPEATCTLKQLMWQVIRKMGEEIRKTEPGLSAADARLKAIATTEGKEVMKLHHDSDAALPVDQWIAKRQDRAALDKLGFKNWDECISKLAQQIAKAHGTDFQAGLAWVKKHCPSIAESHRRERPWARG